MNILLIRLKQPPTKIETSGEAFSNGNAAAFGSSTTTIQGAIAKKIFVPG